jgi:signal transduction histidine kinase/DNA-binding response OmpR family regulator/ligand-binding sensor domain-containing protein
VIFENGQLIAYTNNGQIFSYNRLQDRFDMVVNLSKILNTKLLSVNELLIDHSGTYWIAMSTGLYSYQSGNLVTVMEIPTERYSMVWLDEESLIIARSNGIWLFNTGLRKFDLLCENNTQFPFQVASLLLSKKNDRLWIGTMSNGLFFLDLKTRTLSQVQHSRFPRQPILDMEEIPDSSLLVGVDGQGIWKLDQSGNRILDVYKENADDPFSLPGNGVYDIFCDDEQRVWVCTISGGVTYFDQSVPLISQIVHLTNNNNSLVNNEVNSVIEDRWGKLWFATNNGISCWDVPSGTWRHFYSNKMEQAQVFLALCEDDQGRLWTGSYSSGVYVLDAKTGKELAHYAQGEKGSPLFSNFIFDIFRDSQGDIWMGGVNGEFICYSPVKNRFSTYSKEPISVFTEISPGKIILGCSYGLNLLDKESGELRKILVGYVVQDILKLNGELWVCTSGEGLLRCDPGGQILERFGTETGMPSDFINSIQYADSLLWLGTENGLFRFHPEKKTVHTFSSDLSLSRISFNRGSHCRLRNGQLAWGTSDGALIFTPELIREIPSRGRIYFQDLTISGRSVRDVPSFRLNVPVDSLVGIRLNYTQNTISLELLQVGISQASKFSWKLEGFDSEWNVPSGNRIVSYTNLPSGKFLLRIKLADGSLNQLISERSLAVQVIPPFWKRTWFILLMIIAFSGVALLLLFYYINKLKQKHTEEKVRFFTNTAHEIRTSLTLIKGPVEELDRETDLSVSGRYYLKLAIDQARKLAMVVTQLMDFQKLDVGKEHLSLSMADVVRLISGRCSMFESLAGNRNIKIEFLADQPSFFSAVDELKMEKVIDNLVSNAVKYSPPESRVVVDLKCETRRWILQVKDQGIGIPKKAQPRLFKEFYRGENAVNSKVIGSGIGLLLVKSYVTMHGGTISCNSQENAGSTFQIVIPVKEISSETQKQDKPSEMQAIPGFISGDYGKIQVEPHHHSASDMKLLIVEDNDDLLLFMRNTLGREFNVSTAANGEIAWDYILKHLPDLVISDVMMPKMDGFELCRLVKSTWETSHIPVILLTALSERTEQLHGLGLGADDYLTKPFDIGLLELRIKSVIRNREMVRGKALRLIRSETSEPLLENKLNDKFVKSIVEAVKKNMSNADFNKDDFASAVNVSSSLLYKKVKSLTGQSPTDFIRTIRLDHALDLLQTRQYSITEVSEMCGFSSVGYFSTVFRKQFGHSPSGIDG